LSSTLGLLYQVWKRRGWEQGEVAGGGRGGGSNDHQFGYITFFINKTPQSTGFEKLKNL
jgi:hypothetical protein